MGYNSILTHSEASGARCVCVGSAAPPPDLRPMLQGLNVEKAPLVRESRRCFCPTSAKTLVAPNSLAGVWKAMN